MAVKMTRARKLLQRFRLLLDHCTYISYELGLMVYQMTQIIQITC